MTRSRRSRPALALAAVATFLAVLARGHASANDTCPAAIEIEQEDFLGFADLSTASSAPEEPVLARATAGAGAKLSDPSAAAGMSGEVEGARRAAHAITPAA